MKKGQNSLSFRTNVSLVNRTERNRHRTIQHDLGILGDIAQKSYQWKIKTTDIRESDEAYILEVRSQVNHAYTRQYFYAESDGISSVKGPNLDLFVEVNSSHVKTHTYAYTQTTFLCLV